MPPSMNRLVYNVGQPVASSGSASDSMGFDRQELFQECFMAIFQSDIGDVGLVHA
jgi:hypothetical protein